MTIAKLVLGARQVTFTYSLRMRIYWGPIRWNFDANEEICVVVYRSRPVNLPCECWHLHCCFYVVTAQAFKGMGESPLLSVLTGKVLSGMNSRVDLYYVCSGKASLEMGRTDREGLDWYCIIRMRRFVLSFTSTSKSLWEMKRYAFLTAFTGKALWGWKGEIPIGQNWSMLGTRRSLD